MNMFLIHWAIFLFLIGLVLSLPLGGIYYLGIPLIRKLFTNPRKLKSAHLDYFMQSFSIVLISLLEFGMNASVTMYAVVPLAFGTFFNPFIFLLEATALCKVNVINAFYSLLKFISPTSLFFAWFVILFQYLPFYYSWLLIAITVIFIIAILVHLKVTKQTFK